AEIPELNSDTMQTPSSLQETTLRIIQNLERTASFVEDEKTKKKLVSVKNIFTSGNIEQKELLKGFNLRIWGAGSCGLCCAYLFSCHGAKVLLNEKRGERGLLSACSRTPNISWKNFEKTIMPALTKKDFDRLFESIIHHGGVIDPKSGKLRSSIGAFQEALHEQISLNEVALDLNRKMEMENINDDEDFDIQVICAGVHTKEEIKLKNFTPLLFPGGLGEIFITTTMYPTDEKTGFYRDEWEEGQIVSPHGEVSWRRKNINVQSVETFEKEIDRFVFNLQKKGFDKKDRDLARALKNKKQVAHVFYFGNRRDSYHHGIGEENYPCITEKVDVGSWMFNQFVDENNRPPVVLMGDATGPSHPLAAIGAYLSSKNSVDLLKYCILTHNLKSIKNTPAVMDGDMAKDALYWLEGKMLLDRLMVFLQARLCSHYSR
ncbi:MAG: hypothetical protein OXB84_07705, partial [Halobacteriovoraceae bacterium]|nr:hypothetical protein [Halobacteriovoraceae bacterium]